MAIILTSEDIRTITDAISKGKTEITISLDLGLHTQSLPLTPEGPKINGTTIHLPSIRKKDKSCYRIVDDMLEKIQYISEETGQLYKLVPTTGRALLKISATPMHKKPFIDRITNERLQGNILDSGTGLGYTAISAAKTAEHVTTIEHDKTVLDIARLNPYSEELFTHDSITVLQGDVTERITTMQDETYDAIIFDGGTPSHSAHFFSNANYTHAYRVLKTGGRLFHYLPKPQSTKGRDFISEVENRLITIGFHTLERNDDDSYLIVTKR